MGKLEDDGKALADYARAPTGPGPRAVPPVLKMQTATVTPLNPPQEDDVQAAILAQLDALAADIRAGKVSPFYLIMGYGDDTLWDEEGSIRHNWSGVGIERYEMIGHLYTYATTLATGDE